MDIPAVGADPFIHFQKDKSKLNEFDTKNKLYEWIQPWSGRLNRVLFDTHLKNIERKIIAEEYIREIEEEETEYCVMCSFGKVLYVRFSHDRTYHKIKNQISFDENWNKLNLSLKNFTNIEDHKKPKTFEKMKTIAKELSKDFPLVRVDFYNLKDKLLVGELTFYPNAGLTKYEPIEWDYKFGEMIDLNKIHKEYLLK